MVSSFFTMCCMGNVEMSDGDYANVEDFPLINAEQPEPVARRLGGVVVLILLYESGSSSSRQSRPRCPVKHLWVQPLAATSNIGPRVIGSQCTEEWPLVRSPLELLKCYIDTSGTKSTILWHSFKVLYFVYFVKICYWLFTFWKSIRKSALLPSADYCTSCIVVTFCFDGTIEELLKPAGPPYPGFQCLVHAVELETKVKRRFAKVSIVSYSCRRPNFTSTYHGVMESTFV